MIPVVVAATKYDEFATQLAEKKKFLCRALRYFCHVNGCDLVFTSIRERNALAQYKALMKTHLF